MFQREVAERIVATPGTQPMAAWRCWRSGARGAKILSRWRRSAFMPPPKVTSAVVRIEPLAEPVAPARLAELEAVTAAAFGQRRKMLRQSLKTLAPDAEALLRDAGIDPTERPEQLSVAQFAALARAFAEALRRQSPRA